MPGSPISPPDPVVADRRGCGARRIDRAHRDRGSPEGCLGRDAGKFEEKLRATTSWDERFTVAAGILARRLGARPAVEPEVAYTWRRTVTSRGQVRVHGWQTRSAGAASACRPASGRRSASRPNAPRSWCASTTPSTFSRRVTLPRALPPRAATSTSPTSTARSRRSPGSRPPPWPPRHGSRSTTWRGLLHHEPDAAGRRGGVSGYPFSTVVRAF